VADRASQRVARVFGFLFRVRPWASHLTAGIILGHHGHPIYRFGDARTCSRSCRRVLKEVGYGLGATTWEVARHVVLPYTKIGVGRRHHARLGTARWAKTMASPFVIGNGAPAQQTFADDARHSIAIALANEFTEANQHLHVASLIEFGLILFLITFIVLSLSKLLLMQLSKQEGKQT